MCERIGNMIVCGRRHKPVVSCQECGANPSVVLCDAPLDSRGRRTCDKPLCATCAVHVGHNVDYCRGHADPASRRLAL